MKRHTTNLLTSLVCSACTVFASQIWAEDNPSVTKYVRFQIGNTDPAYGIVQGNGILLLEGDTIGQWRLTSQSFAMSDITILPPTTPSKVLALAGNYRDHLADTPPPEIPQPFYKPSSSLLRHEGNVVQPKDHDAVHYEAELVIVIGKRAKDVSEAAARDYILGVTCGNDISARHWQKSDTQWWRAKGHDTFGPCGPYIVSGLDYDNLDMELRINGEVRQKTNTKDMLFTCAQTVSFISKHVTLEPGDLIFTGTTGTTQGMQIGDVMEVEIEGVGVLRNRLIAAE